MTSKVNHGSFHLSIRTSPDLIYLDTFLQTCMLMPIMSESILDTVLFQAATDNCTALVIWLEPGEGKKPVIKKQGEVTGFRHVSIGRKALINYVLVTQPKNAIKNKQAATPNVQRHGKAVPHGQATLEPTTPICTGKSKTGH